MAVVDDEAAVRVALRRILERDGLDVVEFSNGEDIAAEGGANFDLVCLDLALGGLSGLDVLKHLKADSPSTPVVMVTGSIDVDKVVAVMRAGADEYVTKPVSAEHLRLTVQRALGRARLERSVALLTTELEGMRGKRVLIGDSPPMRSLAASVKRVLASDVAVCILGESGTGKELVARAIHDEGRRTKGPFVAINCASIPEQLQESELFGHEKGSFTGATGTYRGRFEQAFGGTLFLDELGDMSAMTQVKLLRALQEKTIRRVGGTADIKTNLRVIGATHRNLEEMVRQGAFREDLYFRLMVYPIEVPPLRSRKSDIPALVAHLMERHREDVGRGIPRWSAEALDALMAYEWPGNVRELENVVHRAMLTAADGEVVLAHLPKAVRLPVLPAIPSPPPPSNVPQTFNLKQLEVATIQRALGETKGHVANAAKLLGIGRATLYKRLVELGVAVAEAGDRGASRPTSDPE